jgi:hypothetical protein
MSFFYGGRRRTPAQRDYKKEIPRLSKIADLDIKDLKKIQLYLIAHPQKVSAATEENKKIRASNEQISKINRENFARWQQNVNAANAKYEREFLAPVNAQIEKLRSELMNYEVSAFASFLLAEVSNRYISGRKAYFKGVRAERIISELAILERRSSDLEGARPSVPQPKQIETLALKSQPNEYTVLTISGSKVRVFNSDFSLEIVKQLISECEHRIDKAKEKVREIKARADREELAVRSQAKQYSNGLTDQLSKFKGCPYCAGNLNSSNFHQDHIHPVSKGGLSTRGNLVFVCSPCNLRKSDKTLRVFLRDEGLNFDIVYGRLDLLGKH